MPNEPHYRLSKNQKIEIAQNLIDVLQKDEKLTGQTRKFISNWILTCREGKRKAFFDVWNIVLKKYLPTTRPVLYRSCDRIGKNGKIASFTGRFESANRFSNGKGSLIICDTEQTLMVEEDFYKIGTYEHTFFPLVSVLIKAQNSGGSGFSERFLNNYIGEDEYIMRINMGDMHALNWKR